MKNKFIKLLSAGLALGIALSSAPALDIPVSALTIGYSGVSDVPDDLSEVEGTYVGFDKVFGGYKGAVFGRICQDRWSFTDAFYPDYLVREDGTLELITKNTVIETADGKIDIRFSNDSDRMGNKKYAMYSIKLKEPKADDDSNDGIYKEDYNYNVYEIAESGTGTDFYSYQYLDEDGVSIGFESGGSDEKTDFFDHSGTRTHTSKYENKTFSKLFGDRNKKYRTENTWYEIENVNANNSWGWGVENSNIKDLEQRKFVFTYEDIDGYGARKSITTQTIDLSGETPIVTVEYKHNSDSSQDYTDTYVFDENGEAVSKIRKLYDGTTEEITDIAGDTLSNYGSLSVNDTLKRCRQDLYKFDLDLQNPDVEGTCVGFDKVFGGYKGAVFGRTDGWNTEKFSPDYLVKEDGSLELITKNTVIETSDGRIDISFGNFEDKMGNKKYAMYSIKLKEPKADDDPNDGIYKEDYNYNVYTIDQSGTGTEFYSYQYLDEDDVSISLISSGSDQKTAYFDHSGDITWTYKDEIKTFSKLFGDRNKKYRTEETWYGGENYNTNTSWGWNFSGSNIKDYEKRYFVYTSIGNAEYSFGSVETQTIDLSGETPIVTVEYKHNSDSSQDYTDTYVFDENGEAVSKIRKLYDGTTEKITDIAGDTLSNYGSLSVNDTLEECRHDLYVVSLDTNLKIVESTANFKSSEGLWMPIIYRDIEQADSEGNCVDYGIDYKGIGSVDVTIRAVSPELFTGDIGGAIAISSFNKDDLDHAWSSKSFWGVVDEKLGIDTAMRGDGYPIVFTRTDDYTYSTTVAVDETNCVIDDYGLVQIAFQEWGVDYSLIEVLSMTVKDKDGNVMLSIDKNGQASVPLTVTAKDGNKKSELEWTKVAGAAKYDVQRLTNGEWKSISQTEANSYTDADIAAGKYTYRVIAVCDDKVSYVSPAVDVEVTETTEEPENPTPSEPENPTPSEPENPTPSEPENPTPSEPENPTPSEPENPTPSEPENPTPSEPENPTPSKPENPTPSEPENPSNVDNNEGDNTVDTNGNASSEDGEKEPTIAGDDGTSGWDAIKDKVDDAADNDKISIDMNGTGLIPEKILDAVKGKDITLEIELSNGFVWTIIGKDIDNPKDIDLDVMFGSNIPADEIKSLVEDCDYMTITLKHNGTFGFKASLTVEFDKKDKGKFANLYHYVDSGKIEFVGSGLIGSNSTAMLDLTHASEYIIVIDENDHAEKFAETGTEVDVQTGNSQNPHTGVTVSVAAVVLTGAVAFAVKRKKK